ncbi:MAG: hydroxymethylglutaryl-CoA lyase [Planctomycetota bacterium]|nr:hydroxymethylglutaryl-CoA lyase [Planctomycetota bacterium]
MTTAQYVRITDVSPRDGLQNEPGVISPRAKADLVLALAKSGVDEVEVTSFVNPAKVPQLADGPQVLRALAEAIASGGLIAPPVFSVLVPNERGMHAALELRRTFERELGPAARAAIAKVSVFTAASDAFNERNIGATFDASLERFRPVIAAARSENLPIRGYLSCVIACPFSGEVAPARVAACSRALLDLGVDELDLGDTIGAAEPASLEAMLRAVLRDVEASRVTLHLHDTFGRAVDCVRHALSLGIRSFDAAVAGLGGCPFASTPERRAPGNVATEAVVRAVRERGLKTGVDEAVLAQAASLGFAIKATARK